MGMEKDIKYERQNDSKENKKERQKGNKKNQRRKGNKKGNKKECQEARKSNNADCMKKEQ